MKKIIITLLFVIASAIIVNAKEDYLEFKGLTKEQRKKLPPDKRLKYRHYLELKRFGGYVDKRQQHSGKFVFVNSQKTLPSTEWSDQYDIISDVFAVELAEVPFTGDVTPANAVDVIKKCGGNAGVILVEKSGFPSLLVAPEEAWGIVNLAALKADKPDEMKFKRRVRQEVWRGFAMVAGSSDTEWKGCLLNPICSLSDLDATKAEAVSPEPLSKIQKHLLKLGIKPFERVTYKRACQEGWAPMPTNEFQLAIWNKIHTLPQNSMKIEFDPKKGK